MFTRLSSLAFVGILLFSGACSNDSSPTKPTTATPPAPTPTTVPTDAPAKALILSGGNAIQGRNQTLQMVAKATYANNTIRDITTLATWTTSNSVVATVSKTGLVTSVGYGAVDISATYQIVSAKVSIAVSQLSFEFSVLSEGASTPNSKDFQGAAIFKKDGKIIAGYKLGPPAQWADRGFNILVINPQTGEPLGGLTIFDTYITRSSGEASAAMTAFINSLPTGSIILAAVDDDAGLTTDSFDCLPSPTPGSVCCRPLMNVSAQGIQRLFESLGATQLRRYCFRNSYAIITIKGVGVVGEQLINATDAVVSYTLTLP